MTIIVGRRFLDRFRETIDNLAQMPGIGSPYPLRGAAVKLRYSPIRKFRKHIVFYRELPDGGIEVVRLLHAAQNVRAILEEET
jgi:toxin ParE1/3/4